jgi:L-lactate dehydrogenase (cytochrome)
MRMLALGANFVLLGRAWAYALAADGGSGVSRALKLIESELRVAMALTGCTRISDVKPNLLQTAADQATF